MTGSEHREQVLTQNLPLAIRIARRLYHRLPKHAELDDLEAAAIVGLVEAFDRFDPTQQVPFQAYASYRIRGAVLDAHRRADWAPATLRRKANRFNLTRDRLTQRLGRVPTTREIVESLGLDPDTKHIFHTGATIPQFLSLSSPVSGTNPTPIEDTLSTGDNPEDTCALEQMKARVRQEHERLPHRERTAISLHYFRNMRLREVGEALGVSESRACQLCRTAIRRLRHRLLLAA